MPATSLGSRAYDSGVNNFISRSRTHKITATNETQDAAVACGEGEEGVLCRTSSGWRRGQQGQRQHLSSVFEAEQEQQPPAAAA